MWTRIILSIALLALIGGCRDAADSKTPLSRTVPQGSATAPAFARTATPTSEPAPPPAPPEPAEEPAAPEPEEVAEDAPLPDVEVKNVGMHIGGEANTAEQKRPIRAAVAKHYDAMRRCYAKVTKAPKRGATFGVDMRINGDGGPPKVTNPRSGLRGPGVKECLVAVFEGIEFPKQPKGRARMVSFSVAFKKK